MDSKFLKSVVAAQAERIRELERENRNLKAKIESLSRRSPNQKTRKLNKKAKESMEADG